MSKFLNRSPFREGVFLCELLDQQQTTLLYGVVSICRRGFVEWVFIHTKSCVGSEKAGFDEHSSFGSCDPSQKTYRSVHLSESTQSYAILVLL